MNSKDYDIIASAIRVELEILAFIYPEGGDRWATKHNQVHYTARAIAKALEATNYNFSDEKFLKACGL